MDLKFVLFYQKYKIIIENLPLTLAQFAHVQKNKTHAKPNKTLQYPRSLKVKKTLHICPYTQNHRVGK
jgi:hypothetical protein